MDDASVVGREPCPDCNSSDNLARYGDGHAYCFGYGCGRYERADGPAVEGSNPVLEPGGYGPLIKRALKEDTLRKYDYRIASPYHYATYHDAKGKAVAQKRRGASKQFMWIGEADKTVLYGQHLFAGGGKMIVVTEGELDAMSMAQAQDLKWPAVSVSGGAAGAFKCVRNSLEWLSTFERVVFMFDADEAGQQAAIQCAELLPPGRAFIAKLPLKDANAMLVAGREGELISAQWNAVPYRPDGIVLGMDLWEILNAPDPIREASYPFSTLDKKLHGLRRGEIVCVAAGTGAGKSTLCRELAYSLLCQGESVGYIALEESVKKSAQALMSIHLNRPLHLDPLEMDDPALREAFDFTQGTNRISYYDHFGSTDSDVLLSKIRYMAKGLEAHWIVLDHISIMASGDDSRDGERVLLDRAMTKLASLCREVNVGLIIVCHLRKAGAGGKSFEEGHQVTLADLRGTAGIGQLSDIVIAQERNQQVEDDADAESAATTVRVLKNRFSGVTGEAGMLAYNFKTGRLTDYAYFQDESQDADETDAF
jgi:twinkle protein